jgi:hypothetical protein
MPQSSSHFSSSTPSLQISPMSVAPTLTSIPSFDNNGVDLASLNRLQQIIGLLDSSLRLPSTPRAFAIYLLALGIVFAGAFLHIFVAAQIMQAQFTLHQLQEQYGALEQQNGDIIFQIARDTNMSHLHERIVAQGYVPVQAREYVYVPDRTAPIAAAPATTQAEPVDEASTDTNETQPIASAAAAPVSTIQRAPISNSGPGQLSQWRDFWNSIWQSASGAKIAAASSSTASAVSASLSSSQSQSATGNANFWAAWWDKATEQGSKLLTQFHGQ